MSNGFAEKSKHVPAWADGQEVGVNSCGEIEIEPVQRFTLMVGEAPYECPICHVKLTLVWDVRIEEST